MINVFLSIGTNLGNRQKNLENTILLLQKSNVSVEKISSVYETEPWGFYSNNMFFNICISAKTIINCFDLLNIIKSIEKEMGRKKCGLSYDDRIIDIDILFYGNFFVNTNTLIIPHKELHKRRFVLEPLNEIAPDFVHPLLNKTINKLLKQCNDTHKVYKTNIKLFEINEVTIN